MSKKIIHAHNYGHKNIGDDAMASNIYNKLVNAGLYVNTISTYCPPKEQNVSEDHMSLSAVINNYDNFLIKLFIVGVNKLRLKPLYAAYAFLRVEIIFAQTIFYRHTGIFPGFNKKVKSLIDAISASSTYVRSGSGSLNDIWFWSSFMPQYTEVRIAKLFGVKVVFTGQGIGPITGKFRKKILKKFVELCDLITLRDKTSSEKLINDVCGKICNNIKVVGDDAADLPSKSVETKLDEISGIDKLIVCQFRGTDYEKDIDGEVWKYLASSLDELTLRGYTLALISFSNGRINDLRIAKHIASLCDKEVILIDTPLSPEQAKWVISRAHITIGQSYHFGVFSLSENVPFVGFYSNRYYELKLKGLLEWYARLDWCVSLENISKIKDIVSEIDCDYKSHSSKLKSVNKTIGINLRKSLDDIIMLTK